MKEYPGLDGLLVCVKGGSVRAPVCPLRLVYEVPRQDEAEPEHGHEHDAGGLRHDRPRSSLKGANPTPSDPDHDSEEWRQDDDGERRDRHKKECAKSHREYLEHPRPPE